MANPLTSPFTLFVLAVVHSANANPCEGVYTTNERDIYKGIDDDTSILAIGAGVLKGMVLDSVEFVNICTSASRNEKLSICMKVLQHKLKKSRPVLFTIDPNETSLICREISIYNRKNKLFEQDMYDCPTTTVKFNRAGGNENSSIEPSFLIGQGLHATQHRIRVFAVTRTSSTGKVYADPEAQLTGFDMKAVSFKKAPDGRCYTYTPDYDDSGASGSVPRVVSFRETGSLADYTTDDASEPLLRYHRD